ncbi:MAG: response regulator [Planctomycetes bacterium]|nr:response regulator [Planctomycetota bacterium]
MLNKKKVLIVDDDENMLKAFQRSLNCEDIDLTTNTSPLNAFNDLDASNYSVIIADQRMPEISGIDFLSKVKEISPLTVRILMTGYTDYDVMIDAANKAQIYKIYTKPLENEMMAELVKDAIFKHRFVTARNTIFNETRNENIKLHELLGKTQTSVQNLQKQVLHVKGDLIETCRGTLTALTSMMGYYNSYLTEHSIHVSNISKEIAKELFTNEQDIAKAELTALLHDIGMTGLPEFLIKSTEVFLSSNDKELLKRHVFRGEQIISLIGGLGEIPIYIRSHHECFDGSGYPDNLAGKEIPLISRIIRIADFVDRTSYGLRYFNTKICMYKISKWLKECPGRFDPELLGILYNKIKNGHISMKLYNSDYNSTQNHSDIKQLIRIVNDLWCKQR